MENTDVVVDTQSKWDNSVDEDKNGMAYDHIVDRDQFYELFFSYGSYGELMSKYEELINQMNGSIDSSKLKYITDRNIELNYFQFMSLEILVDYFHHFYDYIFSGRSDFNEYPFHNYLVGRLAKQLNMPSDHIIEYIQFFDVQFKGKL